MKCPAVWWILKIPFYRRANFTGNNTDRSHFSGSLHGKIEELRHSNRRLIKVCIIVYIVRIFSSSGLVEPHIIPSKVRLAIAFKEQAKRQVFVRDCKYGILLLYRLLILYWAYTSNFVVYLCCLSWCQLTLQKKKFSCFRGGTCLDSLWIFSAWPAGSAVRIKKKRPKGKKVLKKETKQKKKRYKATENSVAGSRTRFICAFKQLLDHCTTVTHMIWKINFVISKQFFSAIDAVWSWWSCIYHEFKYTFEEN